MKNPAETKDQGKRKPFIKPVASIRRMEERKMRCLYKNSELRPSPEENLRLLMNYIDENTIIIGRPNWKRIKTSIGYWNIVFPNHCCGSDVFFLGIDKKMIRPVIFVSCNHFEHGWTNNDFEMLCCLGRLVSLELFDTSDVYCVIDYLDLDKEKLVFRIEPRIVMPLKRLIKYVVFRMGLNPPGFIPGWLFSP